MPEPSSLDRFLALRLGHSDVKIELQTRAENRHAIDLIGAQVQHTLEIFSRDLDAPLYDREAFLDTVSALCLGRGQAGVRVLAQDPTAAVKRGHRLIELSRRFGSCIEIRQPHSDYRAYNEAFLIADHCGFIHRPLADRHEGIVTFYDPVGARRLLDFFTEVWDRSHVHPDLRRLYL